VTRFEYVTQTLTVGALALQTSQIAVDKAESPLVKEFAQLEIGEQQAIATVLSATGPNRRPCRKNTLPRFRSWLIWNRVRTSTPPMWTNRLRGTSSCWRLRQTLSGETTATVEAITARLAEQSVMSHLTMLQHMKEEFGGAAGGAPGQQPVEGERPTETELPVEEELPLELRSNLSPNGRLARQEVAPLTAGFLRRISPGQAIRYRRSRGSDLH
jgi:putative membrane protein